MLYGYTFGQFEGSFSFKGVIGILIKDNIPLSPISYIFSTIYILLPKVDGVVAPIPTSPNESTSNCA